VVECGPRALAEPITVLLCAWIQVIARDATFPRRQGYDMNEEYWAGVSN
jgi:hypothetical protein